MTVEILNLLPRSDGDPKLRPPEGWILVDPPHIYLHKIAEQWQEKHGTRLPGIKYYLNKLPAGYRLFERSRPGNKTVVDKHLWGHPRGKYFDSPNRFFPHFEHLMKHGSNRGCPCTVCNLSSTQTPPATKIPERTVESVKPPEVKSTDIDPAVKPSIRNQATHTDEEGTPDPVKCLLDKLKHGPVDEEITEPSSMDWIASKDVMNEWIHRVKSQPSWIPRQGEIVLFVRELYGTQIDFDRSDGTYKEFDEAENRFTKAPDWEAGVIAQDANEIISVADLMEEINGKEKSVTYSGFRIEPLLATTGEPKSATKGHKYVPLHHIRPFVFWQRYLKGHPEATWHPSITSGIKVMSSVCLVGKHRLRGTWPDADILCTGLYIGSEFICIGDTAILVPAAGDVVHDFLRVDSIRLRMKNLDLESEIQNTGDRSYSSTIVCKGKGFTLNLLKAWSSDPIPQTTFKGLTGYEEDLFWLHDPSKSMEVSFSRIHGRCYEAESMLMWFASAHEEVSSTSVLSYGLSGLIAARNFSAANDVRILPDKLWFWGDNRLEVLELESLNNVFASSSDELREEKLDEWKYHQNKRKVGRPPKKDKHPMAVGVARALAISGSENENEKHSTEDEGTKKRTFDVAMRDERDRLDTNRKHEGTRLDLTDKGSQMSSRSSVTDEDPLERFKKPRVVVHIE